MGAASGGLPEGSQATGFGARPVGGGKGRWKRTHTHSGSSRRESVDQKMMA